MSTNIPIPADARRPCGQCGQPMQLKDDLHLDEGDGSAMIGLRCDRCRIESFHTWALSDEDYTSAFGHEFDDDGDGDGGEAVRAADATSVPSANPAQHNHIPHGGATASYRDAVASLIRAADQVTQFRADLAAFGDTLAGKKWGAQVVGPIADMDSHLVTLDGTYRDLAGQMQHQGSQGQAAYDQAPYVPGPEAVLA